MSRGRTTEIHIDGMANLRPHLSEQADVLQGTIKIEHKSTHISQCGNQLINAQPLRPAQALATDSNW